MYILGWSEENKEKNLRFSKKWLRRVLSSGIQRRVVRWKSNDVSEEHITIFKVEDYAKRETSKEKITSRAPAYRRYIPEDRNLKSGKKSVRLGRVIAQAVSRRLPIAAARVQTRVWSCGILWGTKVALGQVFSENFGFLCQSTFHLLLHNHLHYHPRLAQ
jgi:hypothetical protein